MSGLRAALIGTTLASLASLAHAEPSRDEPPLTVLDLRPLGAGARTDLDLLPEAAALTQRLRHALDGRIAQLLTAADLKATLGSYYRVQLFACREQIVCLSRRNRRCF